jgi:ferrous iron transport protein A
MIQLSSVKQGKGGTVAALKTEDEAIVRRLMAMGVSPGIFLTLEQRFPSYIIKVGRTRAAVDQETARIIFLNGTTI